MSQPAINATAKQYAARLTGFLSPEIGLGEYTDKMPDHSQEAADAMDSVNAGALAQLDDLETESANDETTKDAPIERLIVERQLHTVGVVDLNNIASPVQDIRSTFDLMPTATSEDRENIATSLTLVGTSLPTYQQRLAPATTAGHPSTTRLADTCIVQLHVASNGFFTELVNQATTVPDSLRNALWRNATADSSVASSCPDPGAVTSEMWKPATDSCKHT